MSKKTIRDVPIGGFKAFGQNQTVHNIIEQVGEGEPIVLLGIDDYPVAVGDTRMFAAIDPRTRLGDEVDKLAMFGVVESDEPVSDVASLLRVEPSLQALVVMEGSQIRGILTGARLSAIASELPGTPGIPLPKTCYRCRTGPHRLRASEVGRDDSGRPTCPLHGTRAIPETPCKAGTLS